DASVPTRRDPVTPTGLGASPPTGAVASSPLGAAPAPARPDVRAAASPAALAPTVSSPTVSSPIVCPPTGCSPAGPDAPAPIKRDGPAPAARGGAGPTARRGTLSAVSRSLAERSPGPGSPTCAVATCPKLGAIPMSRGARTASCGQLTSLCTTRPTTPNERTQCRPAVPHCPARSAQPDAHAVHRRRTRRRPPHPHRTPTSRATHPLQRMCGTRNGCADRADH
ncbi:MAG: hypothetical protein QOD82_2833, partial [Pseudonocardiales bacterium]|nr:hypothetical protein [Pseudonocardiales bacterium]